MFNLICRLTIAMLAAGGASALATPMVDPVTQLQPVPQWEVVRALALGKAARAAEKAGDDEAAQSYYAALEAPIAPEDLSRYKALHEARHAAWLDGAERRKNALDREIARFSRDSHVRREEALREAPAERRAAAQRADVRPPPAPWREYSRMSELRDRMEAQRALRQRVKVRTAEVAVGNQLPVLYPAFHWLPYAMLTPAILEWAGKTTEGGLASHLDENPAVGLLALLNVKIYEPAGEGVQCCHADATLILELAASPDDVELVEVAMREKEPGVYHVADPFGAADELIARVGNMGTRPHLSIAALEGAGFRGTDRHPTVAYAVRWGEFELEYGSHSWLDPEAVIR